VKEGAEFLAEGTEEGDLGFWEADFRREMWMWSWRAGVVGSGRVRKCLGGVWSGKAAERRARAASGVGAAKGRVPLRSARRFWSSKRRMRCSGGMGRREGEN
jgi:hypothetical protein